MIRFSWKKINDKFDWNATSVLEYFFLKRNIPVPGYLNRKVPKKVVELSKLPFPTGPCFVRNIDKLLIEANNPNDIYIYLELASKRNIFDYSIRGILYLPLPLVDEYLKPLIETNPLLKIDKDKIYFKYEQEKQL